MAYVDDLLSAGAAQPAFTATFRDRFGNPTDLGVPTAVNLSNATTASATAAPVGTQPMLRSSEGSITLTRTGIGS